MKKLVFILLFVASGVFLISSCTEEETCKQCKIIYYKNGVQVKEDPAEEKCGDDLKTAENSDPVTIGDETSKYQCN
jgi:hypothetical protein